MWWSNDGTMIGIRQYSDANIPIFTVFDTTNGKIISEWEYPSKVFDYLWSENDNKIIDQGGFILDLVTGEISDCTTHENYIIHIFDWREID